MRKYYEVMDMLKDGRSILLTFKHDAERFAKQMGLSIEYNDGEMVNDEHYSIKGYEAKLYWISR